MLKYTTNREGFYQKLFRTKVELKGHCALQRGSQIFFLNRAEMPKIYGCVIFSAAPFSFQSAYDNMAEVFDQYRFNLELEIKLGLSKSEVKNNGYDYENVFRCFGKCQYYIRSVLF